jgi:hypothetical protein
MWAVGCEEGSGGCEGTIDQFFNEEVLVHREEDKEDICGKKEQSRSDTLEYQLDSFPQHETPTAPRRKSIFHNFQKHLITLIKKFINFQNSNSSARLSPLALALWDCFMKTRSFNKKMLHMVFGVFETPKSPSELHKLSQEFPLFRNIVDTHPFELVAEAQGQLREAVVQQAMSLSRELLESSCNVNRFHEFYEYFTSFAAELRSGPMTKRMTKTRKHFVVEKLMGNTKH